MNGTALRPPDEIIKWRFVRYKSDYRVSIRVARSGEEVVTLGRCSTLSEGSIGGILGASSRRAKCHRGVFHARCAAAVEDPLRGRRRARGHSRVLQIPFCPPRRNYIHPFLRQIHNSIKSKKLRLATLLHQSKCLLTIVFNQEVG